MCLKTIDKKTKKYTIGYKFFRRSNGKLLGSIFTKDGIMRVKNGKFLKIKNESSYPIGEWIKDEEGKIKNSEGDEVHNRGFYFYSNKKDLKKSNPNPFRYFIDNDMAPTICKIKVKNMVASGTNIDGDRIGVAKDIFLIEEISKPYQKDEF